MLIIKINNKTMIKNAPNYTEIVIKVIKNNYRAIRNESLTSEG
jgi:hypothetical protein